MVAQSAKPFKPPKFTPYRPQSLDEAARFFYNLFWFYLYQLWDAISAIVVSIFKTGKERTASTFFLNGNFAAVHEELDTWIDVQQNEVLSRSLPNDFPAGMYVQNGPNPPFTPLGGDNSYHWFDGESMLHTIQISKEKKLRYANRFVRTDLYKSQKQVGRAIYFGLRFFGNPFLKVVRHLQEWWYNLAPLKEGSANTSVHFFAGNLKALMEGAPPMDLELPSLRTLQQDTFEGKYAKSFTAHPKVDPQTKEMFFFGYGLDGVPDLRYGVLKPTGELDFVFSLEDAPYCCMVHDFVITEQYAIVFFFPLRVRVESFLQAKSPFNCYPEEPTYIAVIPKYLGRDAIVDQSKIQWFQAKGGYTFHFCNAYEEASTKEIIVHGCMMPTVDVFGKFEATDFDATRLHEWRLNTETGNCTEGPLLLENEEANTTEYASCVDFPSMNQDFVGRKHSYQWLGLISHEHPGSYDAVVKVDFEKNTILRQQKKQNMRYGEHFFVRREQSTAEDDGFLVCFATNVQTMKSYFRICDARTLEEVFLMQLPNRVPFGFHSTFVYEEQFVK